MSEIISTYSERLLEWHRDYALYAEELVIRGRVYLKADYELRIPLSQLQRESSTIRCRSGLFWVGVTLFNIGLWGSIVFMSALKLGFFVVATMLFEALAVAGLLVCIVTWRKIEFVSFGGMPPLLIARNSESAKQFEQFVTALKMHIPDRRRSREVADWRN